jgi:hypothetical protein
MLSDSEIECLRRFIAAQRDNETFPADRLWAQWCAALIEEHQRLEQRAADLTREVDAAFESRAGDTSGCDTWVY